MRAAPCSSSEHNLHFLTTGKSSHGIMRNEFSFETKISEVVLNLASHKRPQETKALGFAGIDFQHFLSRTISIRTIVCDLQHAFSNPRLISSSRGNHMFSEELNPLKDTSYSYDCFSFFLVIISSIVLFCPSTTMSDPSFIFLASSAVICLEALPTSSKSSPVW